MDRFWTVFGAFFDHAAHVEFSVLHQDSTTYALATHELFQSNLAVIRSS